ncbi:hypothetical protein ACIBI4_00055 [Streptomyces sp. NPDC050418]|uniref:hypothetical protein n=1 Tax=Streptomyces sp. NPDC050418 TaxID=3365612 RepID=UPI0037BC9929
MQDVIDVAGAPQEAARGADGSLLLSFFAGGRDDDEGPAAYAWRLYSPQGKRVADHAEHGDMEMGLPGHFRATAGGFLFDPLNGKRWLLDAAGEKHPVTTQKALRETRPGDVAVGRGSSGYAQPKYAFRPSSRSVAPVPELEGDIVDMTVDPERGTTWEVEQDQERAAAPARIATSAGAENLQLSEQYYVNGIAAGGGTFVAYVGSERKGEKPALRLHRDGAGWREVPSTPSMPLKGLDGDSPVEVLSDGRVLVKALGKGQFWVGSPDGSRFTRVATPVGFTSVSAQGKALVGIADSTTSDVVERVKGEGVWVSTDGGGSWSRFRDGKL